MNRTTFAKLTVSFAAVVLLGAAPASEAFNCSLASPTLDTDNDGINDKLECDTTAPTLALGGGWSDVGQFAERPGLLHAGVPDLFIGLVVRGETPTDPLQFLVSTPNQTIIGLPARVHSKVFAIKQADRRVSLDGINKLNQYFVQVEESASSPTINGVCEHGTPAVGDCTYYPKTIQGKVLNNGGDLATANNAKRHVIAHEIGHTTGNTPREDNRFGFHSAVGTGCMMDSDFYVDGSSVIVPQKFCNPGLVLK